MTTPVAEIRKRMANKSMRKVAAELGVSAPFLCLVLSGKRRAGDKLLGALGLERTTVKKTTYRKSKPALE
jgi:hypothetical protein